MRITLIVLVALAACSKGDVVSTQPTIDAATLELYRPLVGTWTGAMYVDGMGAVSGVITVDGLGRGTFLVTVSGFQEAGVFKVEALDDTHITASSNGQSRRVPIAVEPNRLRLQTAEVGEVILTRAPNG